ncbi:DUF4376 domain-containing protein [Neisseria polysaccharea]|uniref:DUF4376 domain-containing protein n=1 Tax=Neisseria polysaccharea TaxID=489 RepID=UPI00272AB488|nr:DUF4376 domain-containing protein [Neisseria polysaccharea]
MTIYFKNGFYDDTLGSVPEGAVAVRAEEYAALLAGQAQGGQIAADADGKPVLTQPRPSEYHEWDGKKWKISKADSARKKADTVAAVWEKIKQKRHENLRGGVYVESVGKWFHNTDEARQQYTFMRTLPQLPPDLQWKTMDGGFVNLTRSLLDELSLKLLADEQQDFANAERHRVLMEQSDDPENYDYSDGWTENYQEEV